MDAADFQATVQDLIRTIEDPVELDRELRQLVQTRLPAPAFTDGETISFHEFERRFKKAFCQNIEPNFAQWPVTVRIDQVWGGELVLCLGVNVTGKPILAMEAEVENR